MFGSFLLPSQKKRVFGKRKEQPVAGLGGRREKDAPWDANKTSDAAIAIIYLLYEYYTELYLIIIFFPIYIIILLYFIGVVPLDECGAR